MKLLDTKRKKNASRLEMECQSTGRVSKRCMSVWRPRVRMYEGLKVLYECNEDLEVENYEGRDVVFRCVKTWKWCSTVWRPGRSVWCMYKDWQWCMWPFEDLKVEYRYECYRVYEDLEEVYGSDVCDRMKTLKWSTSVWGTGCGVWFYQYLAVEYGRMNTRKWSISVWTPGSGV